MLVHRCKTMLEMVKNYYMIINYKEQQNISLDIDMFVIMYGSNAYMYIIPYLRA